MATTVGQHSVAAFTSPINGTTPIDANTVRSNDNTVRLAYVDHDADTGIHVQSSTLASRPVAGTAGRKWITDDSGVYTLWFDDGVNWHPVSSEAVALTVLCTTALTKGDVVKVVGWNNGQDLPEVAKVASSSDIAFAVMTANATINTMGYATNTGVLQDIATNTFSVGDILYHNTTGGFTATKPTSGVYQPVAFVLRSNASNGVIYVEFSAPRIVEASTNTASTVVLRDGSGNFAAGTITANLTGNISGTAPAGTLTGTTLASNVVSSSLTSVGTLSTLTVSGAITASGGTATGVAYLNVSKVLTTSANLTYDGTTLGIFNGTVDNQRLNLSVSGTDVVLNATRGSGTVPNMLFQIDATERMRLTSTGNLAVDTNTLFVDATNNRVGVGTATPSYALSVTGATEIQNANALHLRNAGNTNFASLFNDSGALVVETAFTQRLRLDASGNLGLGVTPSAWGSSFKAVQISSALSVWGVSGNNAAIDSNAFVNSSGNSIYISSAAATRYEQLNGAHRWSTAPSGTAGNVISFTQAMTLDASGHLLVGATVNPGTLNTSIVVDSKASSLAGIVFQSDTTGRAFNDGSTVHISGTELKIVNWENAAIAFSTNATERARIDASGNLGLGVAPSAWNSSYKAIDVGNSLALIGSASAADLYFNAYIDSGSTFRYRQTATASAYSLALGQHRWYNAPSGTAGAAISFTQAMTLDASGNLGVGVSSPVARLHVRGTSANVNILFRRGADVIGGYTGFAFSSVNDAASAEENLMLQGQTLYFATSSTERARIPSVGGVVVGTAALATTATDGFLYVPTCAGTPTGTPTTQTGTAPIVINTTNNKLYFYSGGAWRDAGP